MIALLFWGLVVMAVALLCCGWKVSGGIIVGILVAVIGVAVIALIDFAKNGSWLG